MMDTETPPATDEAEEDEPLFSPAVEATFKKIDAAYRKEVIGELIKQRQKALLGSMTNARVQADVNDAMEEVLEGESSFRSFELERRNENLILGELALEQHQNEAEALSVEVDRLQAALAELEDAGSEQMFNREQRRGGKAKRRRR